MQYSMRLARLRRPWLFLFGVTPKNAFAEVDKKLLRLRFGLAQYEVELGDIESVGTYHWPSWAGVGWLPNLAGTIALIGSAGEAVEIRLKERAALGRLQIPCQRLLVTIEEPAQFTETLNQLATKAKRTPGGESGKTPGPAKRKPARNGRSSSGGKRSKAA